MPSGPRRAGGTGSPQRRICEFGGLRAWGALGWDGKKVPGWRARGASARAMWGSAEKRQVHSGHSVRSILTMERFFRRSFVVGLYQDTCGRRARVDDERAPTARTARCRYRPMTCVGPTGHIHQQAPKRGGGGGASRGKLASFDDTP